MSLRRRVSRILPAVGAFVLVLIGSWMLLLRDDGRADAVSRVDVVVVTRELPAGTTAADVRDAVVLRSVPAESVLPGAVRSIDEITTGVLTITHMSGQQLTPASFARSRVAAIGPDYVVTSLRLASQNWSGAVRVSGQTVDVYSVGEAGALLVSRGAMVLDSPPLEDVQSVNDAIVTIAVRRGDLAAILEATRSDELWLVGR